MKTFIEIKNEYESKNYSISDLKKSIIFFTIIKFLFTELFIFLVSTIPFLIGFGIITSFCGFSSTIACFYLITHIIFYTTYVKGQYIKNMLPSLEECNMIIKALKEIKNDKLA